MVQVMTRNMDISMITPRCLIALPSSSPFQHRALAMPASIIVPVVQ
jgi:hypothetical protein